MCSAGVDTLTATLTALLLALLEAQQRHRPKSTRSWGRETSRISVRRQCLSLAAVDIQIGLIFPRAILHDETTYANPFTFKPKRYLLDRKPNTDMPDPQIALGFGQRQHPDRPTPLSCLQINPERGEQGAELVLCTGIVLAQMQSTKHNVVIADKCVFLPPTYLPILTIVRNTHLRQHRAALGRIGTHNHKYHGGHASSRACACSQRHSYPAPRRSRVMVYVPPSAAQRVAVTARVIRRVHVSAAGPVEAVHLAAR
ncbi:hypothetical protein B0H17DRAFT_1149490 [Mycena rosella]|uniref:Secreted protein n=1 Tax=Mycena rosella TaxID=1033263 RepID=A0AAD7C4I1_MYCRO|nr:hypothetical protein B0H17DRAFT_1149490 [Mycena rosella]